MTNILPPDEQFYSTRKVADLFNVSTETVVNWISTGLLAATKINGYWRVTRQSVMELGNSRYGTKEGTNGG